MTSDDASRPGGKRPNSDAFKDDPDNHMSVYVQRLLADEGLSPNELLIGHAGFGLVSFQLGYVRAEFGWDALLETGEASDPCRNAHAIVVGNKKPRGPRRKVALACDYVYWPPAELEANP